MYSYSPCYLARSRNFERWIEFGDFDFEGRDIYFMGGMSLKSEVFHISSYMKIIELQELYKFVVCYLFHLKSSWFGG